MHQQRGNRTALRRRPPGQAPAQYRWFPVHNRSTSATDRRVRRLRTTAAEFNATDEPQFKVRRLLSEARKGHDVDVRALAWRPLKAGAHEELLLRISPIPFHAFVHVLCFPANAEVAAHRLGN